MRNISAAVGQELQETYWVDSGLYAVCPEGTRVHVVRLAGDGSFARLDLQGVFPAPVRQCFHVSTAGQIVLIGTNAQTVPRFTWPNRWATKAAPGEATDRLRSGRGGLGTGHGGDDPLDQPRRRRDRRRTPEARGI